MLQETKVNRYNFMKTCKQEKYTIEKAFKELGDIDKKHESGRYTKKQHDTKSRLVLKKLTKSVCCK